MILDWIDPKIMNVIDSKILEGDADGKPVAAFPHPDLDSDAKSGGKPVRFA